MKFERIMIIVLVCISILSFVALYSYEKKLSHTSMALRSSLNFNEVMISSIDTFTVKFDKLNKLTVSSSSVDENTKLKLIEYSTDVSDLVLEMNRKIDLSFPEHD